MASRDDQKALQQGRIGVVPNTHPAATSDDREAGPSDLPALRTKVQSKIDVAKVLGGVITLTLGWAVTGSEIDTDDLRVQVAVVVLLVSLALYVAALEAYDTLLMPAQFWAKSPATEREVAKVIRDKMVCVWAGMFVPATLAVLLGLLLLVWAAFDSAWVMVAGLVGSLGGYAAVTAAFGPGLLERGVVLRCRNSTQQVSASAGGMTRGPGARRRS